MTRSIRTWIGHRVGAPVRSALRRALRAVLHIRGEGPESWQWRAYARMLSDLGLAFATTLIVITVLERRYVLAALCWATITLGFQWGAYRMTVRADRQDRRRRCPTCGRVR